MVRIARMPHQDPGRSPRVSRFRQMIGRGGRIRTDACQVRSQARMEDRFRPAFGKWFRSRFAPFGRVENRVLRRGRRRYRMSRLFEYRLRRRRSRIIEIARTFGYPFGAVAFGFHNVRILVFGNFRPFVAEFQIPRQGRPDALRRRYHVHTFRRYLTGGLRAFREIGVRKRFRNFRVSGETRPRRFEEFRILGQRPLRRARFGRGERIEKRAVEILSQTLRGNPSGAFGAFSRNEGRDGFERRPPILGEALFVMNPAYALRTASGGRIRHRVRRRHLRSLAGNVRIEDRSGIVFHRGGARRRCRYGRIQPPSLLVFRQVCRQGDRQPVRRWAVSSNGHFKYA